MDWRGQDYRRRVWRNYTSFRLNLGNMYVRRFTIPPAVALLNYITARELYHNFAYIFPMAFFTGFSLNEGMHFAMCQPQPNFKIPFFNLGQETADFRCCVWFVYFLRRIFFIKFETMQQHSFDVCHCTTILHSREYSIIYWGLGFLAGLWFGSSNTPSPLLPWTSCLSLSYPVCSQPCLHGGRGGGGGGQRGAKSAKKTGPL